MSLAASDLKLSWQHGYRICIDIHDEVGSPALVRSKPSGPGPQTSTTTGPLPPLWAAMARMEFICSGDEETLLRPCVDCGLVTGRFCDHCEAADRLPGERWAAGQMTPLCSCCDIKYGMCHFCRGQDWVSPPPTGVPRGRDMEQPDALYAQGRGKGRGKGRGSASSGGTGPTPVPHRPENPSSNAQGGGSASAAGTGPTSVPHRPEKSSNTQVGGTAWEQHGTEDGAGAGVSMGASENTVGDGGIAMAPRSAAQRDPRAIRPSQLRRWDADLECWDYPAEEYARWEEARAAGNRRTAYEWFHALQWRYSLQQERTASGLTQQ